MSFIIIFLLILTKLLVLLYLIDNFITTEIINISQYKTQLPTIPMIN